MTEELRHRRGKKTVANAKTSTEESTTEVTPIEQLRHAQARLVVSRERTADLHTAWRNQLFRLSMLIAIICLHAFQSPTSSCIRDIKDYNDATNPSGEGANDKVIGGLQAIRLIFGETFCELLSVITSFLLMYFLALCRNNPLELDHWAYVLSSALVPMQLGFYFHSKQLGCLGGIDDYEVDENSERAERQFPVVIIYHTIVTFAFWFMKSGMNQCEEHVKLVSDSIKDFERMDKKMELKKQLKAKSRKK